MTPFRCGNRAICETVERSDEIEVDGTRGRRPKPYRRRRVEDVELVDEGFRVGADSQ
jgi:hypothetical protein